LYKAGFQLAVRILGSREGAEDVAQQACLSYVAQLRTGNRPQSEKTWFLRIVANAAKSRLRDEAAHKRKELTVLHNNRDRAEPDGHENRELIGLLRQALEALDEKYRMALALCYEQGLTQREASEVLGLPESTLSEHVRTGLARLRSALEHSGYSAAPAVVIGALAHTAPAVPPGAAEAALVSVRTPSASAGTSLSVAGKVLIVAAIMSGAALAAVGVRSAWRGEESPVLGEEQPVTPKVPEAVPAAAAIKFVNATAEMGIDNFQKLTKPEWPACPDDEEHHYFNWPFNLLVGDFNNDGSPDLYCGNHGGCASGFSHLLMLDPKTSKFRIARGDKVINIPKQEKGGQVGRGAYISGVVDIDDDGLLDMVFTDGDTSGTFVKNVIQPGGEPKFEKTAALAFASSSGYGFADLAKTGGLDTFSSNRLLCRGVGTQTPNLMAGSGLVFEGHAHGHIWCADFNGDGFDDIVTVEFNLFGRKPNGKNRLRLFLNKGNMKFEEVTEPAGLSTAPAGNVAVADLTNHGALDILVMGSVENTDHPDGKFKVYRNDGNAHFSDVTPKLKLPLRQGWESDIRFNILLVDLDNDGLQDLVTTMPYGFFRNTGDGGFEDFVALPAKGTGANGWAVAADFNNDGKLDLATLAADPPVAVLRNETGSANKFLKLQLRQKDKNVFAIGAKIQVYRAGQLGEQKAQLALRELMCNNLNSVDYAPILIGVGPAAAVDLRIVFPNGKVVEKREVSTNQTLKIADTEASGSLEFKAKEFQK
jgi:RNA polymerase sigma-70 factor (ECF subfamily)